MRLHEVIEQAAAALFMFRDVLLQCRDRHGADVADCEHRGELDAQGEPFDVAVEFAREHERGLNVAFMRSCCSIGTRMVLKPMAISRRSPIRARAAGRARRWARL